MHSELVRMHPAALARYAALVRRLDHDLHELQLNGSNLDTVASCLARVRLHVAAEVAAVARVVDHAERQRQRHGARPGGR